MKNQANHRIKSHLNMTLFEELLKQSAQLHKHLCPRQVLRVRMGLFAADLLGLKVPQKSKRLLTIMETDGCGADGVSVATNCWVGRRTMRIEDYGKMAATFVDIKTETAVRIHSHPNCRKAAKNYAPEAKQVAGLFMGLPTNASGRTTHLPNGTIKLSRG